MRPTPAEIIVGVRRILREVVEPDVKSDYARAAVRDVRAVLAQVDWDDAGVRLLRENATLHRILLDCRDWISTDAARRGYFQQREADLHDVGDDELAGASDEPFDDHNHRRMRYDQIVVDVIEPLADWLEQHPRDAEGQALRDRLMRCYAG